MTDRELAAIDAYLEKTTKQILARWQAAEDREREKQERERLAREPWREALIEACCPCCGTPIADEEEIDPETGLCARCAGREEE
jgi:hypothetical protein